MRILITGASGFLGTVLRARLIGDGHQVVSLRRRRAATTEGQCWDPQSGAVDSQSLAGAEALIHLAGENIGARRWTTARKAVLRDSRIGPTRALCEFLAQSSVRPNVLICASGIGYYGDRGEEWLEESSPPGHGFLAELVQDWENATLPAASAGIRVVNLRLGLILAPHGGALARMLAPFRMGVGGRLGSGDQYWSWIALDDVLSAVVHTLSTQSLSGPVNVVAPNPVTNREFTRALGQVLRRPTLFPAPAFALRLMLGEMADELLLYSARVRPSKLGQSSFAFRYTELEPCLRELLKG